MPSFGISLFSQIVKHMFSSCDDVLLPPAATLNNNRQLPSRTIPTVIQQGVPWARWTEVVNIFQPSMRLPLSIWNYLAFPAIHLSCKVSSSQKRSSPISVATNSSQSKSKLETNDSNATLPFSHPDSSLICAPCQTFKRLIRIWIFRPLSQTRYNPVLRVQLTKTQFSATEFFQILFYGGCPDLTQLYVPVQQQFLEPTETDYTKAIIIGRFHQEHDKELVLLRLIASGLLKVLPKIPLKK